MSVMARPIIQIPPQRPDLAGQRLVQEISDSNHFGSLCEKCSSITLTNLCKDSGHLHHASFKGLVATFESGCCFCEYLALAISQYSLPGPRALPLSTCMDLVSDIRLIATDSKGVSFTEQTARITTVKVAYNFNGYFPGSMRGPPDSVDLPIFRNPEYIVDSQSDRDPIPAQEGSNYLLEKISGRYVDFSAGTLTSLLRVRTMLHECTESHLECEWAPFKMKNRELPTRLIDATHYFEHGELKLCMTATPDFKPYAYTALSHCWGGELECKLTMANFEDLLTGNRTLEVPPGFRDAIMITNNLGWRYIWIDSLCIIQDSDDDWQEESARMASVYRYAVLTIASAAISSPTSPFIFCVRPGTETVDIQALEDRAGMRTFQHRQNLRPLEHTREEFDIRRSSTYVSFRDGQSDSTFHIGCIPDWAINEFRSPYYLNVKNSKLCSRAWVLQEQMISPRVLYFGRTQWIFECKHHIMAEDGTIELYSELERKPGLVANNTVSMRQALANEWSWLSSLRPEGIDEKQKELMLHQIWAEIVTEAIGRDLSYKTDRLRCIMGIAQILDEQMVNNEYFAGIWKNQLLFTMWRPINDSEEAEKSLLARDPSLYKGPSWTWSSHPMSGIKFNYIHQLLPGVELVDAKIQFSPLSKFDALEKGELVLKGWTGPMKTLPGVSAPKRQLSLEWRAWEIPLGTQREDKGLNIGQVLLTDANDDSDDPKPIGHCCLDSMVSINDQKEVLCLFTGQWQDDHMENCFSPAAMPYIQHASGLQDQTTGQSVDHKPDADNPGSVQFFAWNLALFNCMVLEKVAVKDRTLYRRIGVGGAYFPAYLPENYVEVTIV